MNRIDEFGFIILFFDALSSVFVNHDPQSYSVHGHRFKGLALPATFSPQASRLCDICGGEIFGSDETIEERDRSITPHRMLEFWWSTVAIVRLTRRRCCLRKLREHLTWPSPLLAKQKNQKKIRTHGGESHAMSVLLVTRSKKSFESKKIAADDSFFCKIPKYETIVTPSPFHWFRKFWFLVFPKDSQELNKSTFGIWIPAKLPKIASLPSAATAMCTEPSC